MPNVLGTLTETLARQAERRSAAAAPAASLFRQAGAALEAAANAPASEADWQAALAEWRAALTALTQASAPGAPPLQLILDGIGYRLPPVPGIDAVLSAIPATQPLDHLQRWRDDLPGRASLGPVSLSVLVPTVLARRTNDAAGEVIGLLPPSGLEIAVDAGVARGGGSLSFSDEPHWRLAGSFGLSLGPVSVAAFGILERPGGSLSLVLLLGARFTPGIQLGFGFAISGVGGLIGVNRRADTDALRGRLASGAATDALFADDPSSNAPAILETLGAIFVPAPGAFVVGPTMQLTWLKLGSLDFLRLDLGVFIELPGPARVVIVGRAIAEVPGPGVPLIHLQLDFVGEVDFGRSLVQLRAALVNSQALGIFRAAGDAALVSCWGDPPYQVLSVGGFYPGFDPAPAVIAPLRRIALSNDFDALPGLHMRFEAYLAATTNTFQIGGRLELGVNLGVTAEGHLELDAIFQYRPYEFDVRVAGEFRVGVLGATYGGIRVSGRITGPGPIVLRVTFTVDLLFDDFPWSDTYTIGPQGGDRPAPVSLVDALAAELVPSNLRARGGADPLVAVRPAPASDLALVSPVGTLVFSQRSAPLNQLLERFGGIKLEHPETAFIEPADAGVSAGAEERDYFAPGMFSELTEAERLNQPPYDRLAAGFELVFGAAHAVGVSADVDYASYYRGRPVVGKGGFLHFDTAVLALLGARRDGPSVTNRDPIVVVRDEAWVTRPTIGEATPSSSRTAAHAAVRHGHAAMALPASDRPISLAGVA